MKQSLIVSLLIMLVLAGIAYRMVQQSRKRDLPPPLGLDPTNLVALQLKGLSYLPPRCNIVFALQPGPLLVYAERTKQEPVELLTKNRVPASALASLGRAGVPLEQIDHIVGGTFIADDVQELRFTLALVLRRPVADQDAFLEQLKAKPEGKARHAVEFAGIPMKLAKASDDVWLFGLGDKDFQAESGSGGVAAGMRELLVERVPADAAMWVAFDNARWAEKPLFRALLKAASWPPERIAVLAKGRAGIVGYSWTDPPRLNLAVRCADSESGQKLRGYFRGKDPDPTHVGGLDEWATLALPTPPKEAFTTIKDFFDDAGR